MTPRAFDRRDQPERLAADGAIWVTLSQLALLNGLLDRADGLVWQYAEWAKAAWPYSEERTPEALSHAVRLIASSIPVEWVSRTPMGVGMASRTEIRLLPRGHDILDLKVLCRVRGHGLYRGLRFLRSAS